jgi:hypothetical protein
MANRPKCPNCIRRDKKGESQGHALLRKDGTCPKCGKKYPLKPTNKDDDRRKANLPNNMASNKDKPVFPVQCGVAPIYGFPRSDNEVAKLSSGNIESGDPINDEDSDKRTLKFLIITIIVVLLMMGINALSLLGGSLILLTIGLFGWGYLISKE